MYGSTIRLDGNVHCEEGRERALCHIENVTVRFDTLSAVSFESCEIVQDNARNSERRS